MDLVLRDPDDGSPLEVFPASPESGYLTLTVTERFWRPDRVTVEMDARTLVAAGLVTVESVAGEDEFTLAPRLLVVDGLVFGVEQVHITSDGRGRVSDLATVTGYDPATTPRSLQPTPGMSHSVQTDVPGETAMKAYVAESIGPDATTEREWPALAIATDQGRGSSGTWRARFQQLDDFLQLIGQQTGVGYQTRWGDAEDGWSDGRPVFDVIEGTVQPRILSITEGTARGEELLVSVVDRRDFAYVAGQGEGVNRQIVTRFRGLEEPAGLRRRELFIDARDTDSTPALQSRGDARLAETARTGTVEVDLSEFPGFEYGTDFGLGDVFVYRSRFGLQKQVRVVEVESVWGESAVADRKVTLDRPWPDVDEPVSGGSAFA